MLESRRADAIVSAGIIGTSIPNIANHSLALIDILANAISIGFIPGGAFAAVLVAVKIVDALFSVETVLGASDDFFLRNAEKSVSFVASWTCASP